MTTFIILCILKCSRLHNYAFKFDTFVVLKICLHILVVNIEPSSIGSVADLRTGGRLFDPRLGQHSFRGLMIVVAYWLKEFQENMDRCTGRRDITEFLLKNVVIHHTINSQLTSSLKETALFPPLSRILNV